MQTEDDDNNTRNLTEEYLVLQEERTEYRGCEAKQQKDRRQPHHKEYRSDSCLTTPGFCTLHLWQADAAHVGQIRRHNGQHARAEERYDPCQKGDEHCRCKAEGYEVNFCHNAT